MSINVVIQLFNKIKNGNLVGRDLANHSNVQLLKQYKVIFEKSFKQRIENHKINEKKILQIRDGGSDWWLDETDYSFEEIYQKIKKLDESIKVYHDKLLDISPQLHSICKNFIELDYGVFKLMENSRIMDVPIGNSVFSFPNAYPTLIQYLEDSSKKVMDDFENLITEK